MKISSNPFHSQGSTSIFYKTNGVKYTLRNSRERYFFPDEWMVFYDNLKCNQDGTLSKQQITFNTLLNTGARIMEAQHIRVSDIDFIRGNIVLRITKKVTNGKPALGKKGINRIRVVSVSSKFIKFLNRVVKEYHLTSVDYLPILDTSSANRAMKRTLRSIGIPDWKMFSVHNIRKTSENWFLALGIEWNKVIKQFGHTSAASLKHYLSSDIFSFEEKKMISDILGDIREKLSGGYR